jgi:hypothetical protein
MEEKKMEDMTIYDKAVASIVSDMYAIGKEEKVITLTHFDTDDPACLCLFHCALITQDVFSFKLRVRMKFIDWLFFKFRYPRVAIKRTKRVINEVNFFKFGSKIYQEFHDIALLGKIYNQYYKVKKEKK